MAYTKQTWADLPSKTTPINANRLTHIEDGIFNAAQTADTAASTAGTAAANVGIVSGKVETLTERVNGLDTAVSNKVDKVTGKGLSTNDYDNTDKGKVDSLGTASTKNSTSVVTDSSDLVESGAVKDIVGWGNKNLWKFGSFTGAYSNIPLSLPAGTYTFSFSSNSPVGIRMFYNENDSVVFSGESPFNIVLEQPVVKINYSCNDSIATNVQLEVGSTATAYEPYHASVDESKCDNSVIGTVEDGTNPTKAYAVGEHMIRGGKFCTVTVAVTTSSTWTLGSNYVEGDVAEWLNLSNLHISLSTATNNREIIEQLFTNIIPLLKNDLDSCYGVVKQGGVNTLGFNCFRNTSTTFYAFLYSNDRIFNALYNNGTVTIYQNVGTILN